MAASQSECSSILIWPRIIVVLGIVLLPPGAIIAVVQLHLLVSPQHQIAPAMRAYAGYLASRNMGLALRLLATLVLRATWALKISVLLTAII